ncbi:low molecular weight protein arginine phosphatase [Christensenellaceae bacterium OttesenSCG-928-M15]|nr:low molecular weight protein arginine phosphatase [Christensenellaceae bacterium OttesenSCG-928-M15]
MQEDILKSVLFVCTGNSCRSPMAEAIMEDLVDDHPRLSGEIRVSSAGTMAFPGAPMTDMAEVALERMEIRHGRHRARQLTPELAQEADLILTMEAQHLDELLAICPEVQDNAHTLKGYAAGIDGFPGDDEYDINDPFRQPLEVYEEVAEEILAAVKKVLERIDK